MGLGKVAPAPVRAAPRPPPAGAAAVLVVSRPEGAPRSPPQADRSNADVTIRETRVMVAPYMEEAGLSACRSVASNCNEWVTEARMPDGSRYARSRACHGASRSAAWWCTVGEGHAFSDLEGE